MCQLWKVSYVRGIDHCVWYSARLELLLDLVICYAGTKNQIKSIELPLCLDGHTNQQYAYSSRRTCVSRLKLHRDASAQLVNGESVMMATAVNTGRQHLISQLHQ